MIGKAKATVGGSRITTHNSARIATAAPDNLLSWEKQT
jgi:hypothetical protein